MEKAQLRARQAFGKSHPRVQLSEHGIDPCSATDNSRLSRDDFCLGEALGRNQLRGDVTGAYVFGQCAADVGFDFGGKIRKSEIGHEELP